MPLFLCLAKGRGRSRRAWTGTYLSCSTLFHHPSVSSLINFTTRQFHLFVQLAICTFAAAAASPGPLKTLEASTFPRPVLVLLLLLLQACAAEALLAVLPTRLRFAAIPLLSSTESSHLFVSSLTHFSVSAPARDSLLTKPKELQVLTQTWVTLAAFWAMPSLSSPQAPGGKEVGCSAP